MKNQDKFPDASALKNIFATTKHAQLPWRVELLVRLLLGKKAIKRLYGMREVIDQVLKGTVWVENCLEGIQDGKWQAAGDVMRSYYDSFVELLGCYYHTSSSDCIPANLYELIRENCKAVFDALIDEGGADIGAIIKGD